MLVFTSNDLIQFKVHCLKLKFIKPKSKNFKYPIISKMN